MNKKVYIIGLKFNIGVFKSINRLKFHYMLTLTLTLTLQQ